MEERHTKSELQESEIMNARIWGMGTIVVLLVSLLSMVGLGQGVAPQGVITRTPESNELQVSVWVDQGAYAVGDPITIHYSVNKAAYVYIWDIQPDGISTRLLPGLLGSSNYVTAGEHTLSGGMIAPPLGTEYLQILAATSPVDPFAYFTPNPESFQTQIEAQILGIVPITERSWNLTRFEIVSGTPPTYGTFDIRSVPSGAAIFLDSQYVGYTPRILFIAQGFHQLAISKTGYQTWQSAFFIIGSPTRTINATLAGTAAPTNQAPTAAFTFSLSNPGVGSWIQFDASASFDIDGTISSYAWTFGDGSTGTGLTIWHRFATAGTYLVTLMVTDNQGAQSARSQSILVGAQNVLPTAAFTYSPSSPAIFEWVRFDATSSYDADGNIALYQWSFGGGAGDMGSIADRQFTTAGLYTVTLTVTDNRGATNSVSKQVLVGTQSHPPVAAFTYTPAAPSVGMPVRLDATSSYTPDGTIASYQWDLNGDGLNDWSGPLVQVTYSSAGSVAVRLTVTDNNGLSWSITKTITILPTGGGTSGTPNMGTTPGIFVWGTDGWHITVNASGGWSSPRAYRIELRTDGGFAAINQSGGSGVAPLGVAPVPSTAGRTLVFEGSLQSGSVDYTFTVPGSTSLWMSLTLDTNGDGILEESSGFVYLRSSLVHPPTNPFVVGLPSGYSGALVPSLDFEIGTFFAYTETVHIVFWTTTISTLEGY